MTSHQGSIEQARWALDSDLEELARLRAEARATVDGVRGGHLLAWRDHPVSEGDELLSRALAGADDAGVVVGTYDGAVVGHAIIRSVAIAPRRELAEIVELWVTPDARQVGVGERMLDLIVEWAIGRGCVGIDAEALPGDRDSKNFFETHGLVARSIRVHRSLASEDVAP